MIEHPDGTIEGHPKELSAYIKHTAGSHRNKKYVVQNPPCNVSHVSEETREKYKKDVYSMLNANEIDKNILL